MSIEITPDTDLDTESDPRRPKWRSGFTLVELMVALTISSGLLLAGRLLLEQITTAERVVVVDSAAQDSTLAHGFLLRSLVRNLEVGTDSLTMFGGDEHIAQFTSWCVDTTALRTRCAVRLTIDTTLTVITPIIPLTVLQHTAEIGQFRYLSDARNGGQWYRSWGVGLTVPLAIGIVVGRDTTVLRIGARG